MTAPSSAPRRRRLSKLEQINMMSSMPSAEVAGENSVFDDGDEDYSPSMLVSDPKSAESPMLRADSRSHSTISLAAMAITNRLRPANALNSPSLGPLKTVLLSSAAASGTSAVTAGTTETTTGTEAAASKDDDAKPVAKDSVAGPASDELVTLLNTATVAEVPSDFSLPQSNATSASSSLGSTPAMPSLRSRATTLDVPGLTRSKASPNGQISQRDVGAKLVIVMVGLPARGKSYVTKKLARFLNWQQHNCRIFNVGNTRRNADHTVGPANHPLPDGPQTIATPGHLPQESRTDPSVHSDGTSHAADFFSPDNAETVAQREQWALDTLNELLDYVLDGEGAVGILDATNTTVVRRRMVFERVKQRSKGRLKILFLESICTRSDIIEANVNLKLSGPDYRKMDRDAAIADFLQRLRNYERAYETISSEEEADQEFQYIKMINVGRKLECGNIKGFLASQTVFFLLSFNLEERQIWITRHGESVDNEQGRIGGDAHLTARGRRFSKALARFMEHQKQEFYKKQLESFHDRIRILERSSNSQPSSPLNEPHEFNFCVWSSMLRRAVETVEYFDENAFDLKEMRMLNELDAGICDGMTYEEIRQVYPNEYKQRMLDKIRYRYPGIGGESYLDVINRLRPVIVEVERMSDNCLVVCHRVVARVLLAYFLNLGQDNIGELEVPLHTLYCLEPKPYGVEWALYKYNEKADWFFKVQIKQTDIFIQEKHRSKSKKQKYNRRPTVTATAGTELGDSHIFCDAIADHLQLVPEAGLSNVIDSSSETDLSLDSMSANTDR